MHRETRRVDPRRKRIRNSRRRKQDMSGFFGNLVGQAMSALGQGGQEKLGGGLREFLQGPGLQMLVTQAEQAGLGDKVRSWIGNGENLPISADEIRSILSNQQVEALVDRTGLPASILLPAIAHLLPGAVDAETPNGQTRSGTA